jgi:serine/threonine protein kinase
MEIVNSAECFEDFGDECKFSYLQLIIRENGLLYSAKCLCRQPNVAELTLSKLDDVKLLHTKDRGHKVKPTWTILEGPHDYYIKTPNLWAYHDSDLEQNILHEIEVCEFLKLHPHSNIAFYGGCKSTNGRVSGISFERYALTLLERVNPDHLGKPGFLSSGRRFVDDSTKGCLDGILAGIYHLHSLGIIHNDITPSNVMFKEDGTPVIIDFGSCQRAGESLVGIGRTFGWHDPLIRTASENNDLDAFTELQTWLIRSSPDKFLFKMG